MELKDYLLLLRRRWVTVAVAAALGLVLAGAYSLLSTPTYSARSQVYVSVQGSDSTTDLLQGSNFTVRQVKSYIELVTSPRVLDPVVDELGLADDAASLPPNACRRTRRSTRRSSTSPRPTSRPSSRPRSRTRPRARSPRSSPS